MNVLIISCSLNPDSRSRLLGSEASKVLRSKGVDVTEVDLRDHPLPLCDGENCDPTVLRPLRDVIRSADAIVLAVPIYNYDVNAAAKNLVELTGSVWEDKLVGFLCAAGGQASYMSVMSLANSLMLDFRCLVIPRFVYAVDSDFSGPEIGSPKIRQRLEQLCNQMVKLGRALGVEATQS